MSTFLPEGYITLRQAVIRLAEVRTSRGLVQAYLSPPPQPASLLGGAGQVAARWYEDFRTDPFEFRVGNQPRGGWDALVVARAELRAALHSGALAAFRVASAGTVEAVEVARWATFVGHTALRTGRILVDDGACAVLLRVKQYERWAGLNGDGASKRPNPSPAALVRWMADYTRPVPGKSAVTRDSAIVACTAAGWTVRACRGAWNAQPDDVRGKRGIRKSGK